MVSNIEFQELRIVLCGMKYESQFRSRWSLYLVILGKIEIGYLRVRLTLKIGLVQNNSSAQNIHLLS